MINCHSNLIYAACLAATALTLSFVALPALAQVTLAPTLVFVDHPDRYGTVLISNTSDAEQEIDIQFQFGYPMTDSTGKRLIEYADSEMAATFGLDEWVRAFPKRFRLAPRERQRVRLMIAPPVGLPEDLFWTRMVVSSLESRPADDEDERAFVDVVLKQVVPVVFKKGDARTNADVVSLKSATRPDNIDVLAVIERTGPAPFFGTISLRICDRDGVAVQEASTKIEAYVQNSAVFTFERASIPPGNYTAEIELTTRRSDVRTGALPQMEKVTRRIPLIISTEAALTSSRR